MKSLTIFSHAKVNIGLKVLNKRLDGYHNIHTVFQELELQDRIRLEKISTGWSLTSDVDWIPLNESNLCVKAYNLLKDRYSVISGLSIHLEKTIPAGAGLGGGSSNCAAILKGMNRLFNLAITEKELEISAMEMGADVPFFIKGGTQIGSGTGDELKPLSKPVKGTYLLVIPDIHISTQWAYGALKKGLETTEQKPNFAGCLSGNNPSLEIFENDFERIVIPAYPEIGVIKKYLLDRGAKFASLSGSGSTVFGIFDDETGARQVQSDIQRHYHTFLTSPIYS